MSCAQINIATFSTPCVARAAREQSYALQYTSLILILLTFIVGTFVRPHLPIIVKEPTFHQAQPTIGLMNLEDIFEENSANIKPSSLQALITFVKAHDVDLDISVFADNSATTDAARITLALARSVTVFRHLLEANVAPQNLVVSASAEPNTFQLKVEITYSKVGGANAEQ